MKFGGFQPFTLSDFPGRTAAVVFTQGCNLRCPFCHNGALLTCDPHHKNLLSEDEILSFLRGRKGKLDGFVVTGGEPTLQPGLIPFLRKVRALGYQIKLDTNGTRPEVIVAVQLEGLVDYIAMDLKAPLDEYGRLTGTDVCVRSIEKSIDIIANSGIEHEFRTTVVEALLSPGDLAVIRAAVPKGSPYKLQNFRAEHALDKRLAGMPPRVDADELEEAGCVA